MSTDWMIKNPWLHQLTSSTREEEVLSGVRVDTCGTVVATCLMVLNTHDSQPLLGFLHLRRKYVVLWWDGCWDKMPGGYVDASVG